MKPTSKIVQIVVSGSYPQFVDNAGNRKEGFLIALCEDGSVWVRDSNRGLWRCDEPGFGVIGTPP